MRIAICDFRQETDSFNPVVSNRHKYEIPGITAGQAFYDANIGKASIVGGMLDVLIEEKVEPVMLYSMCANSGGPVDDAVVAEFIDTTVSMLRENMPVDGLLVSLHGATQSTTDDDICGLIVETLRKEVGEQMPIAATFDLHANITSKIQRNADFICGYQTYPHVDFHGTGARGARRLVGRLKGRENAHTYRTTIPMLAAASSYTTLRGMFGEVAALGRSFIESGKLLDYTVFQQQPWLDVSESAGGCIVTIAESEQDAKEAGMELARRLFDARKSMRQNLVSIDEVIAKAEKNDSGKPIALADSPDSPNAGACGDSPALIERIKTLGSDVKAAFYINDSKVVDFLWDKPIGTEWDISLGATLSDEFYKPLAIKVRLNSKHDGHFLTGPNSHLQNVGRVVNFSFRNVDILAMDEITVPGSLQLYRHFGIEPMFYQLVNVKACTSFRTNYEPICLEICEAATPGAAPIDLENVSYRKVPKTFWPWSDISDYVIPQPVALR